MSITASPLSWPTGWKRTDHFDRAPGPFRVGERGDMTIEVATRRLRTELRRFGVHDEDIILSTNLKLRLDGFPYSSQAAPRDPGAAVYWKDIYSGEPRSMAIDRYTKVDQNIAALAATIDAMRAIERHGGAEVIARAFTGFLGLPAPAISAPWFELLEVPRTASRDMIEAAFKRLASKWHPDKHADDPAAHAKMAELNLARSAGLAEAA